MTGIELELQSNLHFGDRLICHCRQLLEKVASRGA